MRHCAVKLLALGLFCWGTAFGQESGIPVPRPSVPSGPVAPGSPGIEAPTAWFIDVKGEPAAKVWAETLEKSGQNAADAAARTHLQETTRTRAQVRQSLMTKSAGRAVVLYDVGRVLNGIAVVASPGMVQTFRDIDGVEGIRPLRPMERQLDHSVPFIGASSVWTGVDGLTGQGIRLGVIDTGIDYLHTDFDGPGTGYGSNDTTTIGDIAGFPGTRVVGGIDLVGDDYNAGSSVPAERVGAPDPDPMDCHGHGTHVAGIAGGSGVNGDGSVYTGSYDENVPFDTMKVAPGVAPGVDLYAIKIFGCEGSTNYVVDALEWASDPNGDQSFDDRLDVVNLSVGSAYGSVDSPEGEAADFLASLGCLVVASAGNSGDTTYVTGGPAAGKRAIGVASSYDDSTVFAVVDVSGGPVMTAATALFGPALDLTGITGELALADPVLACDSISNSLSGKVAYIDRGDCAFSSKVLNAQNAGAIAVIIGSNQGSLPTILGGTGPGVTIPSVMVSQADGTLLKTMMGSGTVNVTLQRSSPPEPTTADTISSYTSRGPLLSNSLLKPDICAPGSSISSAAAGSGSDSRSLSGTSMASPHIAGVMALLRQQHPAWSVEELKALVMSTATHPITTDVNGSGFQFTPQRVGTGRVDLVTATKSETFVSNSEGDGTVSLSFGRIQVTDTLNVSRDATIYNRSEASVEYSVGYTPVLDLPGVSISVPGSPITVPANGSAIFSVDLSINVPQMDKVRDSTMASQQSSAGVPAPRDFPFEESGIIELLPSNQGPQTPRLWLATHVFSQPSSMMAGNLDAYPAIDETGIVDIPLTGTPFGMGNSYPNADPLDSVPLVFPFELLLESEDDPALDGDMDAADLKALGFRQFPAENLGDRELEFVIATYGEWETPNEVYCQVEFDYNNDGSPDAELINYNLGWFYGDSDPNDTPICASYVSPDPYYYADYYLDGYAPGTYELNRYGTNTMILMTTASRLGLSEAQTSFRYRVSMFHQDRYLVGETTDWYPCDIATPGLEAGENAYFDLPGITMNTDYTKAGLLERNAKGILLVHKHNTTGTRVQKIPLLTEAPGTWLLH